MMSQDETIMMIKATPTTIASALDQLLASGGFVRAATRPLGEDAVLVLPDPRRPFAFILAPQQDEWTACWSLLEPTIEWELAAQLARELEQPVACAIFLSDRQVVGFRFWEDGVLRAEHLPTEGGLDPQGAIEELVRRGVPRALLAERDRAANPGYLVLGYTRDLIPLAITGNGLLGGTN